MLKKLYFYSITIVITVITITNLNSQNLEKKEFKKANTIRIYIKDTTIEQSKERFVDYINKTGFHANIVKMNFLCRKLEADRTFAPLGMEYIPYIYPVF